MKCMLSQITDSVVAEVIGENISIDVNSGRFDDDFGPIMYICIWLSDWVTEWQSFKGIERKWER